MFDDIRSPLLADQILSRLSLPPDAKYLPKRSFSYQISSLNIIELESFKTHRLETKLAHKLLGCVQIISPPDVGSYVRRGDESFQILNHLRGHTTKGK